MVFNINGYSFFSHETEKLLKENKPIVNVYNYNLFIGFALLTTFVFFMLVLIAFIPNLTIMSTVFRYMYLAYFFGFAALYTLGKLFKASVERHPLIFMYIFFALLHSAGIFMNLSAKVPIPYTISLCFIILMPFVLMDFQTRIIVASMVVWAFSLAVSWLFKADVFFVIDCMNCTIFSVVGVFIGDMIRFNQIRYMDMKEHKLDMDLEIMKAKTEAKSGFLASMSHEIRTPINAMLGMNEMILRECTDQQILHYANNVQSSGRMLLSLINDILDFSKIEANKLNILPMEYHLDSALNDLIIMAQPRLKEKKLEFKVIVDENIPNVLYGDEMRIKQCILNLLTNAIKYTNEGSVTLQVGYQSLSKRFLLLKVQVVDTGIGIKSKDITALFTAFERLEEKRNRTIEGTGLGMSIVMGLLEKMGSTLYVKSEYGHGSRFWFNLQQEVIDPQPIGSFEQRMNIINTYKKSYTEAFHAPRATVLVIDDVKLNLDVFCALLKKTQIRIDTAMSGDEALKLVREKKYDLIFIDHRMPIMDGIETLHAMKTMTGNLSIDSPCIALTANVVVGARAMYVKKGFMDYLSKPVDYEKLEQMLLYYLPPEMVEKVTEEDSSDSVENDGFWTAYNTVLGIDAKAGLYNSSDFDVLKTAVTEYYRSLDEKSAQIERYAATKDYENYTIQVHALKSSSRLIGALELSDKAKHLEECGENRDEAEIAEKTPELLKQYRALRTELEPIVQAIAPEVVQEANKPKEPLTDERFAEMCFALREYAKAGDFTTIKNLVMMVSHYDIPPERVDIVAQIQQAAGQEDGEGLLRILQE